MTETATVTWSRGSVAASDLPPYPGIGLDLICLVGDERQAAEALDALLASDAVGFDTESKPTFRKGEVSSGPHLVQLATEGCVYLFQLPGVGLATVKAVLESPRVLKAGFGLGNDRAVLKNRLGIELQEVIDLGEELRGAEHRGTVGAKVAVAHFFGQKLQKSKRIGTSNWANPKLTDAQLLYAANDAHVALRVYRAWRRLYNFSHGGVAERLNAPVLKTGGDASHS